MNNESLILISAAIALTGCEPKPSETAIAVAPQPMQDVDFLESALAKARERTGLLAADSLWQERSRNGRVTCGALREGTGPIVLYMYGNGGDTVITAPAGFLSERVLAANARSVIVNCGDHGVVVPEHLR